MLTWLFSSTDLKDRGGDAQNLSPLALYPNFRLQQAIIISIGPEDIDFLREKYFGKALKIQIVIHHNKYDRHALFLSSFAVY